jgi:hypothetical protein
MSRGQNFHPDGAEQKHPMTTRVPLRPNLAAWLDLDPAGEAEGADFGRRHEET